MVVRGVHTLRLLLATGALWLLDLTGLAESKCDKFSNKFSISIGLQCERGCVRRLKTTTQHVRLISVITSIYVSGTVSQKCKGTYFTFKLLLK